MNRADVVVECRTLFEDRDSAALQLSMGRPARSVRVQLLRLDTGGASAFSVFAASSEGPVTFEASANLHVPAADLGPEAMLRDLVDDAGFRRAVLAPMLREIDRHFGRRP